MSKYHVQYRLETGNPAWGTGGSTIADAQARADRDGFAGAAVFRYLPGLEQHTDVVAIRQPGQPWEPFEDRYHLRDWWIALDESVRAELVADPDAPVSAGTLDGCVRAGVPVVSDAWWVDSEDGPSGFYLPPDVAAFIRAVSA